MDSKYGVDVSSHNGYIDWSLASNNVDFCFIRGGYGNNHIDNKFYENARGCYDYHVPFGIYWFSYALSVNDAINEANYACDLADKYKKEITYICYDWEYDSDNYASIKGVKITSDVRVSFANAFLNRVTERGYKGMLYANPDYIKNKGFDRIKNYPLWLAQWGTAKPSIKCLYWQTSCQGSVNGIRTNVDINVSYDENKKEENNFNDIMKKAEEKYINVAKEIIAGKYGIGKYRKNKLKELGYDYELAQSFVNRMIENA